MFLCCSKAKLLELKAYVDNGDWSWKLAGFTVGLSLSIMSFYAFISHLFGFAWFLAVTDLYLFSFGLVACILEYKEYVLTQQYIDVIRKEALFLYRPYGRAAFYSLVGLIKLGESDIISEIIGLYAFVIGIVIFIVSKNARDTLIKLKHSISTDEELLIKFRKYDIDDSGYLDRSEISALCRDLGTPLSLNQLEVVILTMDKTPDGKISYEEFLEWWTDKNNDWA